MYGARVFWVCFTNYLFESYRPQEVVGLIFLVITLGMDKSHVPSVFLHFLDRVGYNLFLLCSHGVLFQLIEQCYMQLGLVLYVLILLELLSLLGYDLALVNGQTTIQCIYVQLHLRIYQ